MNNRRKLTSLLFNHKIANTPPDIRTPEGFEQLYRANFKKLFAIAYNQVRVQETAEGLVHNVFLKLWERREQINITDSIDKYLVGAVKLAVMDHVRKISIRAKHIENILADTKETENYIDHEYEAHELQDRILNLVNHLPHQCQAVYKLSREQGRNNKEIASILLIAEKTVESHLTKALKYLKSNLAEYNY